MTHHLVLVGLSGSGKSSVGRRLAVQLGRPCHDSDNEIERRAGRAVRDIFEQDGETSFRELEADVMADLLSLDEPSVIASGGGAVVTESTRKLLYEPEVFVVWLTASPAFLASRAAKKTHRPLLDDDAAAALARLLDERRLWYEAVADVTYDVQPDHEAAPKPHAKDNIARAIAALVPE